MKVGDYYNSSHDHNKIALINVLDLVNELMRFQNNIKNSNLYAKNEEVKLIDEIISCICDMEISGYEDKK